VHDPKPKPACCSTSRGPFRSVDAGPTVSELRFFIEAVHFAALVIERHRDRSRFVHVW
jgi:hypothetical protein